jgi:CBS domain-containing protein
VPASLRGSTDAAVLAVGDAQNMATAPQKTSVLADLTAGDLTASGLVTCFPDDGLATVASNLIRHDVHAALLLPHDGGVPLLVSDLDLVRAALTQVHRVEDIKATLEPSAALRADAPIADVVATMAERYVRHLLVTDPETGAPIRLVSALDVVAALGGVDPDLSRQRRIAQHRPPANATSLRDATVDEVAQLGILTCIAGASLLTVARTMAERRVHCVAIAGIEHPGEHLIWGLIEDIDIVVAMHRDALSEPAASIARKSPIAVEVSDSLTHAAELLVEHDASHVVVVGPTGLAAGIISTLDVASVLAAGLLNSVL